MKTQENKELIREVIEGLNNLEGKLQKLLISDQLELAMEKLRKLLKESDSELEVGKWYRGDGKKLVCVTGFRNWKYNYVDAYGFDSWGNWFSDFDITLPVGSKEATHEEIESALIEEAERRYKVGDNLSCFDNKECRLGGLNLFYDSKKDVLYATDGVVDIIFNNGEWATIIEEDKFAELKEAHKNGAVIQFKAKGQSEWMDAGGCEITFGIQGEYRIKPEPKVGDVISARPTLHTSNITMSVNTVEKVGLGVYQINGLGVIDVTVLETDEEILNSIK